MRSLSLITIWPAIQFYSKLTISLLTILSKTGPSSAHNIQSVGSGKIYFAKNDTAIKQ